MERTEKTLRWHYFFFVSSIILLFLVLMIDLAMDNQATYEERVMSCERQGMKYYEGNIFEGNRCVTKEEKPWLWNKQ
jgi:hypothetical protein